MQSKMQEVIEKFHHEKNILQNISGHWLGRRPTPATFDTREFDAFENERQFAQLQFDAFRIALRSDAGQFKRAAFQPTIEDRQAIAREEQDFHRVAAATEEQKQATRLDLLAQFFFDDPDQPVKALSHVGRSGRREHRHVRWEV